MKFSYPVGEHAEQSGDRERLDRFLLPDLFSDQPQPWCRMCQKPATKWAWARVDGDQWRLHVECHGEEVEGALPRRSANYMVVPEAFCFDEPHLASCPFWYVGFGGVQIQLAQSYLDKAVAEGGYIRRLRPVAKIARTPLGILGLTGVLSAPAMIALITAFMVEQLLALVLERLWSAREEKVMARVLAESRAAAAGRGGPMRRWGCWRWCARHGPLC